MPESELPTTRRPESRLSMLDRSASGSSTPESAAPESLSPDAEVGGPEYVCVCVEGDAYYSDQCFFCRRCLRRQHYDCADRDSEGQDQNQPRCNFCVENAIIHICEVRDEHMREMKALLAQKRAEANELYKTVLWRQYCILPNENAPQAVIRATETKFSEGTMRPIYSPPWAWVVEVMQNIEDMREVTGNEMEECLARPDADTPVNERILTPWRELAVWLLHHGPYKGRREKLGLLGEVLGLEVKGKYCDRWLEVGHEAGEHE
ncbi:hypothetical protein LTR37_007709 [Vermiconidia calcicola]|uniref:Uncharacterized protein n=1 Tax=Vermiconidia calcicola TaxID=1690605 RepID=A0ACC3ND82_9PEZI|nr:hypothetical protein LTR37_007709 [Vermiconidia calcicola]